MGEEEGRRRGQGEVGDLGSRKTGLSSLIVCTLFVCFLKWKCGELREPNKCAHFSLSCSYRREQLHSSRWGTGLLPQLTLRAARRLQAVPCRLAPRCPASWSPHLSTCAAQAHGRSAITSVPASCPKDRCPRHVSCTHLPAWLRGPRRMRTPPPPPRGAPGRHLQPEAAEPAAEPNAPPAGRARQL